MNVIGIVVEYNPLHNGHIYQINKIKEMYPDSIIIVVMTGNYTMRGEISLLSKWNKTKLALDNDIDIVLELPLIYSHDSADNFSYAALKILNEFKIDTLVFGSESNDIDKLYKVANIQNTKKFNTLVKEYISKGYNYPTSLSKVIKELINIDIKESNDLLGVSYIKEIINNKYNIKPITIKRTNDFKLNNNTNIVSAYVIREKLNNNEDISKYIPYNKDILEVIDYNKFYELVRYKIISEDKEINKYLLVDEGIENKLIKNAYIYDNYKDFINSIKNKRLTINRINRILINIFTSLTKGYDRSIKYIRLLGLSSKGLTYYKSIKKDINIPVYTKYNKNIDNIEYKSTLLYSLVTNNKSVINDELKNHTIIK